MATLPDGQDPSRNHPPRPAAPSAPGGRRSGIGAATAVRGQLSAREDLWIDGQFEGEVQAPGQQLTVGAGGRVRAEVRARAIVVEGELTGTLVADEQVAVRVGGRVQGDIRSPRVVLEDGCYFQGTVDMDNLSPPGSKATPTAATAPAESAVPAAAEVRS